jgi:hypothetical protein
MNDAVEVVDGRIPDGPAYPPVVTFLGVRRPSERHQELGAVLLYGSIRVLDLWSGDGKRYRTGTGPVLYPGRLWRYLRDRPS